MHTTLHSLTANWLQPRWSDPCPHSDAKQPSTLARLAVRFYGHSHTQNGGGIAAAELRYGVDSVHARLEAVIFLEMARSMQDWLGSAAASQIVHKAAVTRAILPFYGTASPPTAANGRCIAASS